MISKILLFGAALAAAGITPAAADYPERPITVIVPFRVGGGTDIGARTWGRFLEACLGGKQSVIVQNVPGAGGQIGFAQVATSAPDGYTLASLNVPNIVLGPVTRKDLTFSLDSFDYLATLYASRTTLSVRADSPVKSISELIEQAKTSGNPINIGISGIGSDDHLLAMKLERAAGVKVSVVPFGDSAGVHTALLGGHTDLATLSSITVAARPEGLRALVVAHEEPIDDLPGVPTFKDAGFDVINGTTDVIGAPKGLPAEVRDTLGACFQQIAADPAFQADIDKLGVFSALMDGTQTEKFVRDEEATLKALWEASPWE